MQAFRYAMCPYFLKSGIHRERRKGRKGKKVRIGKRGNKLLSIPSN
jgi:hypothetical protein